MADKCHPFLARLRVSLLGCTTKLGSNLGPFAAELGTTPTTTTQNKAKRTKEIDYFPRLCKQGVTGSNPVTSTTLADVQDRIGDGQ